MYNTCIYNCKFLYSIKLTHAVFEVESLKFVAFYQLTVLKMSY